MFGEREGRDVDRAMLAQECTAAARRGAEWICSQMAVDGALGEGVLHCYKAPWALASAGRPAEANRLLDWIARHAMPAPGQFHLGDDTVELQRASTYRNAWIMIGAQALGRWDVVSRTAEADFLAHQHASGAFHSDQAKSPNLFFNMNHTAFGGLWCLYRGQTEAARRAADTVVRHLELQPDLASKYVIPWTAEGGVIDQPTPDQVMTYDRAEGHFFYWGTPAAFLTQAALYLGEPRYLCAAATLEKLALRLPDAFDRWPSSGKLAWGAAWLYRVTGQPLWEELAGRVTRCCLLDSQQPDGCWPEFVVRLGGLRPYAEPATAITSEFTLLCTQIAGCLAR